MPWTSQEKYHREQAVTQFDLFNEPSFLDGRGVKLFQGGRSPKATARLTDEEKRSAPHQEKNRYFK